MFKVNNKDTRTTSFILVSFIVNFEHISHIFLVLLLFTLSMHLFAGLRARFMLLMKDCGKNVMKINILLKLGYKQAQGNRNIFLCPNMTVSALFPSSLISYYPFKFYLKQI